MVNYQNQQIHDRFAKDQAIYIIGETEGIELANPSRVTVYFPNRAYPSLIDEVFETIF